MGRGRWRQHVEVHACSLTYVFLVGGCGSICGHMRGDAYLQPPVCMHRPEGIGGSSGAAAVLLSCAPGPQIAPVQEGMVGWELASVGTRLDLRPPSTAGQSQLSGPGLICTPATQIAKLPNTSSVLVLVPARHAFGVAILLLCLLGVRSTTHHATEQGAQHKAGTKHCE